MPLPQYGLILGLLLLAGLAALPRSRFAALAANAAVLAFTLAWNQYANVQSIVESNRFWGARYDADNVMHIFSNPNVGAAGWKAISDVSFIYLSLTLAAGLVIVLASSRRWQR